MSATHQQTKFPGGGSGPRGWQRAPLGGKGPFGPPGKGAPSAPLAGKGKTQTHAARKKVAREGWWWWGSDTGPQRGMEGGRKGVDGWV